MPDRSQCGKVAGQCSVKAADFAITAGRKVHAVRDDLPDCPLAVQWQSGRSFRVGLVPAREQVTFQ
jgi:hypothetical protein